MNFKIIVCKCCQKNDWQQIKNTIGGTYISCNTCGYQMHSPKSVSDLNEEFELAQDKFYGEDSVMFSPLFNFLEEEILSRRIKLLKKTLTKGKIMEIGPGNGSFLSKAIEEGYEVDAVEHSKVFAQEINNHLGLNIKSGKFENQNFNDLKFDAYLSFHVIEHVPDVITHLKKANDIVKTNGYAFIATPNAKSWEQKIASVRSPNYCISHLHLFSKESLSLCLNQTGWKVVHVSTPSYISSWPRVITSFMRKHQNQSSTNHKSSGNYIKSSDKKIFWIVKFFGIITKPFRLIQEALQSGNELFIIAQKSEEFQK